MRTGPRTGFRWTPETIVYAITLWYRKHSRTPFTSEWDQAGENHPSRQTVARVFGSWNAAMQAAGFTPRPRGRQPRSLARGSPCRRVASDVVLLPGDGIGPEVAARSAARARAARARGRARRAADRRRGDPRDRLAAAGRDARRVPVGDRRAEGAGRRPGVRRGRRASRAGAARAARRARHVREPPPGGAGRRRRADRARARRRPLLRRERRARGRHGVRHVRVPPAPGRANRAARVPARAVARAAS